VTAPLLGGHQRRGPRAPALPAPGLGRARAHGVDVLEELPHPAGGPGLLQPGGRRWGRGAASDPMIGQRPFLDALGLLRHLVRRLHPRRDGSGERAGGCPRGNSNFVSQMVPQGDWWGSWRRPWADQATLVLHGTVRPAPRRSDRPIGPSSRRSACWDRPEPAGDPPAGRRWGKEVKLGGAGAERRGRSGSTARRARSGWRRIPSTPAHGYSGTLAIPSAGIEVKLGADLEWNLPRALLYGEFEGVSLGEAHPARGPLTGFGRPPPRTCPADLQKAVDALSRLSLMHVALHLEVEDGGDRRGGRPLHRRPSRT